MATCIGLPFFPASFTQLEISRWFCLTFWGFPTLSFFLSSEASTALRVGGFFLTRTAWVYFGVWGWRVRRGFAKAALGCRYLEPF